MFWRLSANGAVGYGRRMRLLNAKPRDQHVEAYVRGVEGPLGQTTEMLVELVRKSVPRTNEVIHHGSPKFCVGLEPFCYVAAHAKHVNLGFFEGALLDDPDGLLEGSGKRLRHVKLQGVETVPRAKLTRLIRQAAARMKANR